MAIRNIIDFLKDQDSIAQKLNEKHIETLYE
jgi:hypothetical protein